MERCALHDVFAEKEQDVFKIGDQVCYPMHGVGIIEGIEDKVVLGEQAKYYVLRFLVGRMSAMVPVATAEKVGLRYTVDASECEKVLEFLKGEPCEESDNWNQRYRDNYEKMRQGDIYAVADVVKCLRKRDAEKGLSSGERKMLMTATQVLFAELAAASGSDYNEYRAKYDEKKNAALK